MNARSDTQTIEIEAASELRARAARIRDRSHELVEALGPDHPLVARALDKARALELQADSADIIRLR